MTGNTSKVIKVTVTRVNDADKADNLIIM